jgi:general stress protein 26
MTTDIKDKAAVEKKLWDEIGDTRFGMVGLTNSREHLQPMATFVERETGKLWFYTQDTTDLAAAASKGVEAMYVFMSQDRHLQASIRGTLTATNTGIPWSRPGFPRARTTRT